MAGDDFGLDEAKRQLRAACQAARDALPADARRAHASQLTGIGLGFCRPAPGAMLSAYRAIGSELDPAGLFATASQSSLETCLPVIQPAGQPLMFRRWRPGEPLLHRMWGIMEPAPDAGIAEPNILLVPLLAFDARGMRLGYGGGYYDRTLQKLRAAKPVLAIGLAYDEQEIDAVPCGPHDEKLDWVLTPSGPRRSP